MDGRGEPHAVALDRGPAVAVELRGRGPVAALRAIGAALRRRSLRAVVTTAPAGAAHAAGWALRRRGLPWIAVVDGRLAVEAPDRWHRAFDPRLRALRRASLLVATDATEAARMHHELGLAPAVAGPEASAAARHLLQPRASGALRVLMLGTLNAPHVEHLALAMRERGMDVIAGGDLTPAYPRTVLPDAGVPTSVLTLPAIPWLRRLLREQRPDVVHAHWLYGAAFLAAVAGAKPLIAMAWGSDVYAAEPRHLQMGRFALRRAAVAMTDSADLVGRLIEMGADPAATHVLNWGVDLDRFSPGDRTAARAALGLPDVPTILSPRAPHAALQPADDRRGVHAGAQARSGRPARAQAHRRRSARPRQTSRGRDDRRSRAARADGATTTAPPTSRSRSRRATARHARCGRRWPAARRPWCRTCRG